MTQLLAEFNFQQTLASGVIGGGAALALGAVIGLFKKPPPKQEGLDTASSAGQVPGKLNPLVALGLLALGLGLVVVGIIWRVSVTRQ
jgi:hypothetical protein